MGGLPDVNTDFHSFAAGGDVPEVVALCFGVYGIGGKADVLGCVKACYVGEDGGMALFSKPGDSVKGKWYYYYQPTDWTIGNYMLGTRDVLGCVIAEASGAEVDKVVDVLQIVVLKIGVFRVYVG